MHITSRSLSVSDFLKTSTDSSCGASVIFIGTVRNRQNGKSVKRLYYECYEPLANQEISRIIDHAKRECRAPFIYVLHRVGWLAVGEVAVVVEAVSAHREEAFQACRMVIDEIKKTVPIWKKEVYKDGTSEWILCSHPLEAVL